MTSSFTFKRGKDRDGKKRKDEYFFIIHFFLYPTSLFFPLFSDFRAV